MASDEYGDEYKETNYVQLEVWRANHEGGTKHYNAILLTDLSTMKSVTINRWGRVGTLGEMKSFTHPDPRGAKRLFDAKIREKAFNRGYNRAQEAIGPSKVLKGEVSKYVIAEELTEIIRAEGFLKVSEFMEPLEAPEPPKVEVYDYSADKEWGLF